MTISHSTLLTPHFTLHTPHSTLHTPHSSLHTPHSSLLEIREVGLKTKRSAPVSRVLYLTNQVPVIYLHRESPRGSSVLPSAAEPDSLGRTTLMSAVYMNLQPPVDTARRSPAGWWSLTPPSHPCRPCGRRSFSSAVTCSHPQLPFSEVERPVLPGLSSRTPLRASDRPEHCISGAKVRKILLNRNKEVRQFVRLTIFAPKFARRK